MAPEGVKGEGGGSGGSPLTYSKKTSTADAKPSCRMSRTIFQLLAGSFRYYLGIYVAFTEKTRVPGKSSPQLLF